MSQLASILVYSERGKTHLTVFVTLLFISVFALNFSYLLLYAQQLTIAYLKHHL